MCVAVILSPKEAMGGMSVGGKRPCIPAKRHEPPCVPPGRALESRLQALEAQHEAQMNSLQDKREQLQNLLGRQTGTLTKLKNNLQALSSNSSSLQQQQQQLMELVQRLARIVAQNQRTGKQQWVCMGWDRDPRRGGERP